MVPVDSFVCELSDASNSFVLLIRCPPMDGFWHVRALEKHSFVNSAITCIRSVMRSAFPIASSRTSFATVMPRKCFEPVSAFLS